jgi:hypothetical protein
MDEAWVLSETEVFELVAFLVTSARLLPEEPTDYGPARLLTAAQRLSTTAGPRSRLSDEFFRRLAEEIAPWLSRRNSDPAGFQIFLEESCRTIAREAARRLGRGSS